MKNDEVIQELIFGAPNQYELTVRGRPEAWTKAIWAGVYGFAQGGLGLASRAEKFATKKFRNPPHAKEGYTVNDYRSDRDRRLLEFLIPLLYSEKPTQITMT